VAKMATAEVHVGSKKGFGASEKRSKATNGAQAGRFGVYGGRYVPETLMAALEELEWVYDKAKPDPKFQKRLDLLLRTFAGRPHVRPVGCLQQAICQHPPVLPRGVAPQAGELSLSVRFV